MFRKMKFLIIALALLLIRSDAPEVPTIILLLGDSVTSAGHLENNFGQILQERLGERAIVINAGIGAARVPHVFAKWDEYTALHPTIVVIYLGTNDVRAIYEGKETWEQYRDGLLKLATLAPHAILVTPHRGRENPSSDYYLAYVEQAASLVRNLGYPVADVYLSCCQPSQLRDHAHPNEEGHQIIADTIYPLLLRSLCLQ